MGRCWRSARGSRRRRNPGRACFSGELFDDRPDPAFGGFLVIDIAIDARREPFGTQFLEPAVEPLAGLAVECVGRVAQRQNGTTLAIELRRFSPLAELEKARRRLRGQIGRATGRERGCQYVWVAVVAVSFK